jgi:hypothetical protein
LAAALMASGCANRASAPPQIEAPAPGMAALYVLNMSTPTVFGSSKTIYDGERKIVTLDQRRYAVVQIAPGRHTFTCDGLPMIPDLTVNAAAGQTYFLEAAMGATFDKELFAQITPEFARKLLPHLKPQEPD